ncbi:MAG: hypothetical protein M1363_06340 [Gammaproteobacteria bacterium]|nr:hypothetical protein [Gammaproteobacteria bacterium]
MIKSSNPTLSAVITGDIVKSTELVSEDFACALKNLDQILSVITDREQAKYEMFRGDSFQLLLSDGKNALKYAVLIRLAMKFNFPHVDIRQSVGLSYVDGSGLKLATSRGEAFTLSGHGLEQMKKQLLTIHFPPAHQENCCILLTRHLDGHLQGLSKEQALVLFTFLWEEKAKHQDIANRVGKSRANTTQLLNACDYRLVADTLNFIAQRIQGMIF